ncbi:unnamed protein product [Bursaphelenchus xylophilus]|uniref:(pine wood nematode) hypothetical protein n=1 Tax=Bursaphelenchus xylophilus TaxID=6326 RepID=A0A1I7RSC4_BURXY|nr:unnamed protein product [Bursaphelenchus xylophilus]CAG9123052.1 unnamed protein product [Bursaphelenchus xylophilus]
MASVGTRLLALEEKIKKGIVPRIESFNVLGCLEKHYDQGNQPVQETHLVQEKVEKWQMTLRINELVDEDAVQHLLREIEILEKLESHKRLMNLLGVFRHRQYLGLLFPAFLSLKEKIEARKIVQGETKPNAIALFHRDCVAMVLRPVIKALRYIHSKGYVHTQLQSLNLYMNENCYVKLGGFGYARNIRSTNWVFLGDHNLYPPEVLKESGEIKPSIDYWGLGLLTMEIISGKRFRHCAADAKSILLDYLNRRANPPRLKKFAPKTYDGENCIYNPHVVDFLSKLMAFDSEDRMDLVKAREHPFVSKGIDKKKCMEVWNVNTSYVSESEKERSLREEMTTVIGDTRALKPEFLKRLLRASRLAAKDFHPIFDSEDEKTLLEKYYLVQLTIPIPPLDEGWSRDVLDISNDQDPMEFYKVSDKIAAEKNATPDMKKRPSYVNRNDQIFFVKRDWTEGERQLFVGLQVARWYHRGYIEFQDVIKIANDIEDLFTFYISDFGNNPKTVNASDIYLYSPLRFVYARRQPFDDDNRPIYNAYINIAVGPESMVNVKRKYDQLAEMDRSNVPAGKMTLHQSVVYRELDLKRFRRMEAAVLGSEKAAKWESQTFEVDERRNTILPLVYERRCNRNREYKSNAAQDQLADEHDHDFNQIRTAKIWSEFDRNFLKEKYGDQLELHHPDAVNLFGHPFEEKEIEKTIDADLYRGKVYQEEDYISPFSSADTDRDLAWSEGYYKQTTPSQRQVNPVSSQASVFDQSFDESKHIHPSPGPKLTRGRRAPNH